MGFVFGFILGVVATLAVTYFYPKIKEKIDQKRSGTTGPTGTSF